MAGHMTDWAKDKAFNLMYRNTAWTPPTTVWVGLFPGATPPTDAGGGTEFSGDGYARVQVVCDAPTNGVGFNNAELLWTASGGAWAQIEYAATFDAETNGNMMKWNTATNQTLADGDSYRIAIGDLDASFD